LKNGDIGSFPTNPKVPSGQKSCKDIISRMIPKEKGVAVVGTDTGLDSQ
jgi:hypothetical protein